MMQVEVYGYYSQHNIFDSGTEKELGAIAEKHIRCHSISIKSNQIISLCFMFFIIKML